MGPRLNSRGEDVVIDAIGRMSSELQWGRG